MRQREREAFPTGKPHQSAVAAWARARLVDQGGRHFDDGTDGDNPQQTGCLFADGVGLGKTWEALGAVALLLDKRALRRRKSRARRARKHQKVHVRRREAHVLVLLPPGLVAKWSRELRNPDKHAFPHWFARWARNTSSRGFVAKTFDPDNCFEIRNRGSLDRLPRGRLKHRKYTLPPGTYLCNWNVFVGPGGRGRDRVSALRNQRWDVVVVDEAHHRRARKALDKLRHPAATLLLTATPFQLDMTELHGLTRHLVEGNAPAHKVLKRGAARDYAQGAANAFDGGDPPGEAERRAAERVLGQLIACSKVGRQRRHYFAIDGDGEANQVVAPSLIEAADLENLFERGIKAPEPFQEWYLRQRLKLARREADEKSKHVAVELRKLLSVNARPAPTSPRLDALRRWARSQFVEDLELTMKDGKPRKLLVFTHLKTNVARPLKLALEEELLAALEELARSARWRDARRKAAAALDKTLDELEFVAPTQPIRQRLARFGQAVTRSPLFPLFGAPRFARTIQSDLNRLVSDEQATHARARHLDAESVEDWFASQRKVKQGMAVAVLDAVVRVPLAATFTGDDSRRERDAMAEAFKTSLAPWILVATNVGSEGIDLHTYSRHLVHFDLEWNPARMEQREGRIDRLGRALPEPARIHYLLVKDTYDERMFHQLIARQRWHRVLLGRKALQLTREDDVTADLITRQQTDRIALDLDPRSRPT